MLNKFVLSLYSGGILVKRIEICDWIHQRGGGCSFKETPNGLPGYVRGDFIIETIEEELDKAKV